MNLAPEIAPFLRQLFPATSSELLALLQSARQDAGLLQSDCQTIRDWLDISGYKQESLIVALVLMILAQDEGSLCIDISRESLAQRLRDVATEDKIPYWAGLLVADLAKQDFSKLIGTAHQGDRPVIRHGAGDREYLYFQKYLRHEQEFAEAFRAKLLGPQHVIANLAKIMRAVVDENPPRQGGKPLVLDADQRRAVELALSRNLVLISGGPGTGKTSIVLALVRCLTRAGLTQHQIALAAPTGRAAQRLADAIRLGLGTLRPEDNSPEAQLQGMRASTLHQLLEYNPGGNQFRRHAENSLAEDVVIVDEVSMVGMVLMARLFQAVRPQTRLILLGDKDQLPSVDAGAVLANLMSAQESQGKSPIRDALVLLRTNHRSEAHIREVAAAVNQQKIAIFNDLPKLEMPRDEKEDWSELESTRGVRLLEQIHQSPAEIRAMLRAWADYAFLSSGYKKALDDCGKLTEDLASDTSLKRLGKLFDLLEKTRLLTLIREGPWGCVEINRFLDQYLRPTLDRNSRGSLFQGAPVLITRNDSGRGLFNGDVGIALRGNGAGLRVVFPRQGSYLSLPADALPAHELGFALTVHKSQGSEYGQVLLVFPPSGARKLLTKELVYTGITRAKDLVVLCATRAVLKAAVERKCVRESGIMQSF
jgi:exodeoxyribonuclease V alpha subunit